MHQRGPAARAAAHMQVADLYRLGALPTEQPHPWTRQLSRWAADDLPRAVSVLKNVDLAALDALAPRAAGLDDLATAIRETLAAGKRIYLCGCGATGRLSMSLETLWRQRHPDSDQVRAFMAGGDVALVHALEGFEDHPALGARHLREMGFTDGDLLISSTEGGETPFVIGATRQAAAMSRNAPFFLYCNGDAVLGRHVQRFRDLCHGDRIRRLCLDVGPMALSGSTRMQASTALQLAVGAALLHGDTPAASVLEGFRTLVQDTEFLPLVDFISAEAAFYEAGDLVTYHVRHYGITVLTDTTERAPTFSLVPFDQLAEERAHHSLCYVSLEDAFDPGAAWHELLRRTPRPLDWPEVDPRATPDYLLGFDFSRDAADRRRRQIPHRRHHVFRIGRANGHMELALGRLEHAVPLHGAPPLQQHLLLKLMLNIHSTLVMGRLGRFQGNVMTWVTPTNGKLVDRAARYVQQLLAQAGDPDPGYERIVHQLFVEMDESRPGEAVVLRTFGAFTRHRQVG